MEILTLSGVGIDGVAACLPSCAIQNDERIAKATGILARRRAAAGTTVVDLCVAAAERLMDDTGTKPEEIGAVVFVSFTQHHRMPCAAVQSQARLGLANGVIAFDVTLACSGWGYGLYLAALLARQTGKKTLLLDGDVQSEFMKDGDAATEPLLADGGTATIVSPSDTTGAWRFAFVADGAKGDALKLEHGGTITMDGFAVFRFVATDVVRALNDFLSRTELTPASFDAFVPHQPNVYMVRQLAKSVGFDADKTVVSCDTIGNLSSASVSTALAQHLLSRKGRSGRSAVLFAGFGGGLSVSIGSLELPETCKAAVFDYPQK